MIEIVVAVTGIVGTLGGLFISWERKKLAQLRSRIDRLEQEVKARILVEQVACDLLHMRGYASTPRAAMLRLRDEVLGLHGVRPAMTPRDVE